MPLTQDSRNGLEARNGLEEGAAAQGLALDCYLSAIRVLAHYAIDLEDGITGPYKKYLNALADDTEAGTQEALLESRGTLRGLLRDYRDKAAAYLNQMRRELAETTGALQRILDILAQSEGEHEIHLRKALQTLRELARGTPDGTVLPGLREAADTIEASLTELGRSQQLTVSQFLVEIGLLHKRIDALESAVSVDALTKLFTRGEIEQRIRSAESGSLLLLSVEGFGRAATHFSPEVAKELAGAFIKRLRNSVLPDALLGRRRVYRDRATAKGGGACQRAMDWRASFRSLCLPARRQDCAAQDSGQYRGCGVTSRPRRGCDARADQAVLRRAAVVTSAQHCAGARYLAVENR